MYEGKGVAGRGGPSNTLGGKDIFRSHRWHIATLAGFETTGDNEDFKLYAKKIKLPTMHLEQEVYKGLGAEYKFASQVKFPDVSCSFYDIHGLYLKLDDIRQGIFSPSTGVSPASSYKGDTVFVLEDPENAWLEYRLYGSFIRELNHSELTYEGKGDFKSIDLVISYDYFEVKTIDNPFTFIVAFDDQAIFNVKDFSDDMLVRQNPSSSPYPPIGPTPEPNPYSKYKL